jgi:hypothetical protein
VTARFSDDYAIDPKNWSFEGDAYAPFYPREFILEMLALMGLAETDYEEARKAILGACANYESHKRNKLEFQAAHNKERDAQLKFAKKTADYLEAFEELRTTGNAFPDMIMVANEGRGKLTFTLPDLQIIKFLGVIANKVGGMEEPTYKRTPKSLKYFNWVLNLSALLEKASIPISIGSYYSTGKYKDNSAIGILLRLLRPIDPTLKEQNIVGGIETFVSNRNQGKL